MKVVLATGSAHKLREIRAILAGLEVELVPMSDFDLPSPVEDGDSFEANALIKARACVTSTDLPAIADDSGIEVDALGGAPGVISARWAGESSDDAANNAKLVAELRDVPSERRTARYVAVAALVLPDGTEILERGTMEGRIVLEPRGTGGFGYDPHFIADATTDGRTNAELAPHEKDAISHRGLAFRRLRPHLERLAG